MHVFACSVYIANNYYEENFALHQLAIIMFYPNYIANYVHVATSTLVYSYM